MKIRRFCICLRNPRDKVSEPAFLLYICMLACCTRTSLFQNQHNNNNKSENQNERKLKNNIRERRKEKENQQVIMEGRDDVNG